MISAPPRRPTDVIDHYALHCVQFLLHARRSVRVGVVPLFLDITHSREAHHQLSDRRGEVRHGERLSSLGAVSGSHQREIDPTRR